MAPLVTVAIPTRNRQNCAATLVKTLLDTLPDCQVVVTDNSDDDSLRSMLADRLTHPSLCYRYQPGMMSMVENFNWALGLATGEYITFLGDDDMIGARFHDILVKAKAEGIDALLYRSAGRVVHYYWPGVSSRRWGDMSGRLYLSRFTGRGCPLDVQKAIRNAILHLGEGPRRMPRAYFGVVSRALIDRVQAKHGPLFGGVSPDVYSSHLLAVECCKPVVIDYPFILPGASPTSASGANAKGADVGPGALADAHIKRFTKVDWDPRVPNYYSPPTVWSQSLVEAHRKTGTPIPLRGFAYLYATCALLTFPLARVHLPSAIRAHQGRARRLAVTALSVMSLGLVAFNYVVRRIPAGVTRRPGGARFVFTDLPDSRVALEKLQSSFGEEVPQFCR